MKPPKSIECFILTIRGLRIMLDADLAHMYGVSTKRFNEAFKRNRKRFPDDFAFQLTASEFKNLRSQFATSSSRHRGAAYRPWAFTEHGALMAANILRSEQAVLMSIYVVRAFVKQREQIAANTAILKRLAEIDKSLLQHDAALRDIYQKLLPLLQPPPDPPKRRIGFISDDRGS